MGGLPSPIFSSMKVDPFSHKMRNLDLGFSSQVQFFYIHEDGSLFSQNEKFGLRGFFHKSNFFHP